MRLLEFQQSDGIATADQILLVDNPAFTRRYHRCLLDEPRGHYARLLERRVPLLRRRRGPLWDVPAESTILFVGHHHYSFDDVAELDDLFRLIENNTGSRYAVVLGKGDYRLGTGLARSLPRNVRLLAGNGVVVDDARIQYLPMGRDYRGRNAFRAFRPRAEKTTLVYCNFSLNTHASRPLIYEAIKDRHWAKVDHMGNWLGYTLSHREFLENLAAAKFAICPRGAAIDTFRLWDCLYVGTIPIVVREASFHDHLADLPVLFVDSPGDYEGLNEEVLTQRYAEMLERDWNYEKLRLDYWLRQIERVPL